MAVMYWRFAGRKNVNEEQGDTKNPGNVDDEPRSAQNHLNTVVSGDLDRSDDI